MAQFRYRAIGRSGAVRQGTIEAPDRQQAATAIRRESGVVVELFPVAAKAAEAKTGRKAETDAAVGAFVAESAVLLRAGLPLDRALALAIDNIEPRKLAARFTPVLAQVREGQPLSAVLANNRHLFSATAVAMCEAGEANGRLPEALERLAEMLERAAELRQMIAQSSIYPISLLVIAVGVVLLMLLFVVPQFESVIGSTHADLPAASLFVLGASRMLRENGFAILLGLGGVVIVARQMLARPGIRAGASRLMLNAPGFGPLIQRTETAKFARTLGALVEGEVALPQAMLLAQRTIGNPVMSAGLSEAAASVREGGSLSAALAHSGTLPALAMGFIRTGEESSDLGRMLTRLADVLDRDVKARLQRLVAIMTPLITVILGASVAGIVAAIMSAILGFNDLAVAQ